MRDEVDNTEVNDVTPQVLGRNYPMLLQLHYQDTANLVETEFLAQYEWTEATTVDEFHEWMREMADKFREGMPEGWCFLVVTQDSPLFTWAASP